MRSYFWCYYHPVCINWWKIYEVTERRWERGFPVADWLSFCIFVPTKNPHFVSSFRQRILVLYLRSDEEFSFYFSYFLGLCFHRHRKFSWASYPKMTEIWASGLWIVLSVTIIKSSIMTAQQKNGLCLQFPLEVGGPEIYCPGFQLPLEGGGPNNFVIAGEAQRIGQIGQGPKIF